MFQLSRAVPLSISCAMLHPSFLVCCMVGKYGCGALEVKMFWPRKIQNLVSCSQDVVDRSYSGGREGDGFDSDTTSATNQKRGGSGFSSPVWNPAQWPFLPLHFRAHMTLLPHLTCWHFYMFTILHRHKLDPPPSIVAATSCKEDLKSLECKQKLLAFNQKATHQLRPWLADQVLSGEKTIRIRAEALRCPAILLSMSLNVSMNLLYLLSILLFLESCPTRRFRAVLSWLFASCVACQAVIEAPAEIRFAAKVCV